MRETSGRSRPCDPPGRAAAKAASLARLFVVQPPAQVRPLEVLAGGRATADFRRTTGSPAGRTASLQRVEVQLRMHRIPGGRVGHREIRATSAVGRLPPARPKAIRAGVCRRRPCQGSGHVGRTGLPRAEYRWGSVCEWR